MTSALVLTLVLTSGPFFGGCEGLTAHSNREEPVQDQDEKYYEDVRNPEEFKSIDDTVPFEIGIGLVFTVFLLMIGAVLCCCCYCPTCCLYKWKHRHRGEVLSRNPLGDRLLIRLLVPASGPAVDPTATQPLHVQYPQQQQGQQQQQQQYPQQLYVQQQQQQQQQYYPQQQQEFPRPGMMQPYYPAPTSGCGPMQTPMGQPPPYSEAPLAGATVNTSESQGKARSEYQTQPAFNPNH